MNSNLKKNLEILLAESKSYALINLKNNDPQYAEKISRWSTLNEALTDFFENDEAELTSKEKEMMKELMELESEIHSKEQSAIYIQGYFDCICVMKDFGIMK